MKKNQYYPFDDFLSHTIFGYGSDGEQLPWREVAKRMRTMPSEKNSDSLEHLTVLYKSELKYKGEDKALEKFWGEVDKLSDFGFLTEAMKKVLLDARDGDIKSAQVMIRAAPITAHLPFIARAMRSVISQHKYCDTGGGLLSDIRASWNNFLPDRTGGKVTYGAGDLNRVFMLAKKQMRGVKRLDPKGKETEVSDADIRKEVAQALKISSEYLKKHIKLKAKRGRPKK